jgi:WD40 repeat protein
LADNLESELELVWQGRSSDLVTDLNYAPTGGSWVASSAAGEVFWNAGLAELVTLQPANGLSIERVSFSADGRWLAAGGQAGKLFIWNCADPQMPPQLVQAIDIGTWIEHLEWHPSQPELAISSGKQIQIWAPLAETAINTWNFDRSSVFDLKWHPTGVELAAAGYKGIQIWTRQQPKLPPASINVDTASIDIAWAGDGRYLAAGNLDRTLTISDRQQPSESWTLMGCPGKIRQLAWLVGTDTHCLAVASGMTIVLWQLSADATTWNGRLLEGHQGIISTLVAHPHTPKLASGGADGYTCIWTENGEVEQIIVGVASRNENRSLALAKPLVREASRREEKPSSMEIVSEFTSLSWYPNKQYLATGDRMGELCIWRIPA